MVLVPIFVVSRIGVELFHVFVFKEFDYFENSLERASTIRLSKARSALSIFSTRKRLLRSSSEYCFANSPMPSSKNETDAIRRPEKSNTSCSLSFQCSSIFRRSNAPSSRVKCNGQYSAILMFDILLLHQKDTSNNTQRCSAKSETEPGNEDENKCCKFHVFNFRLIILIPWTQNNDCEYYNC